MPNILGIRISKTSEKKVKKNIKSAILGDSPLVIFTPNPEIVLSAQEDAKFAQVLNSSDLSVLDGVGIYVGFLAQNSRLPSVLKYTLLPFWTLESIFFRKNLEKRYGQKVCGSDLTKYILSEANEFKKNVVILDMNVDKIITNGDQNKVNQQRIVCDILTKKYPQSHFRLVKWLPEDKKTTEKQIQELWAPIIIGASGIKSQELAIHHLSQVCSVSVCIGAGGSIDLIAGFRSEPPKQIRTLGLEWLYRLIKTPKKHLNRVKNVIKFGLKCV